MNLHVYSGHCKPSVTCVNFSLQMINYLITTQQCLISASIFEVLYSMQKGVFVSTHDKDLWA